MHNGMTLFEVVEVFQMRRITYKSEGPHDKSSL